MASGVQGLVEQFAGQQATQVQAGAALVSRSLEFSSSGHQAKLEFSGEGAVFTTNWPLDKGEKGAGIYTAVQTARGRLECTLLFIRQSAGWESQYKRQVRNRLQFALLECRSGCHRIGLRPYSRSSRSSMLQG